MWTNLSFNTLTPHSAESGLPQSCSKTQLEPTKHPATLSGMDEGFFPPACGAVMMTLRVPGLYLMYSLSLSYCDGSPITTSAVVVNTATESSRQTAISAQ